MSISPVLEQGSKNRRLFIQLSPEIWLEETFMGYYLLLLLRGSMHGCRDVTCKSTLLVFLDRTIDLTQPSVLTLGNGINTSMHVQDRDC